MVSRAGHDLLEEMREGAVAEVVEQGRRQGVAARFGVQTHLEGKLVLHRTDALVKPDHHVRGPERVGESRVFGAGEDQGGQPELAHSTQALNLSRRQERLDDALVVVFESHQAMHGVAEDHE